MTERRSCHAKIISETITFPDPDGHGEVNAVKGEIRLMYRHDAKDYEVEGRVKILSDAEVAAAGLY